MRLEQTWRTPAGLWGALSTVDHKIIGRRYIVTAFVFLALGGVLAALMRLQLAAPEARLIGPDRYNQIFTMHGSNMMFLFAVPVMEAMAVYLVPLMVGTRNIAFPRLNAFSYWMFLAGGALLWISFALDMGPDVGWFAYVPLVRAPIWRRQTRRYLGADDNLHRSFRARGRGRDRRDRVQAARAGHVARPHPACSSGRWSSPSFLIIMAMPAIMIASTMLILDRLVGTHFFNPAEGGDVLLWQHLFWFFGHPEVYIIFLPAVGMVSTIVATFARRPVFGYLALVMALISTGVLAFGLWVHHMFVTGLPRLGESFFTASSMAIADPGRRADFLLAGDVVGRPPGLRDAAAIRHRLYRYVRDRRTDRRDGRLSAVRYAGARYLFRRRAFPLCPGRRSGVSAARRDLLLVPEDDGPDDERALRDAGRSG